MPRRVNAKKRVSEAGNDSAAALRAMDDLVKCVEGGVAGTLERLNEDIAFQASRRTRRPKCEVILPLRPFS